MKKIIDEFNELIETYQEIMKIAAEHTETALPALLTAVDYCRSKMGMSIDDVTEMMRSVESLLGTP